MINDIQPDALALTLRTAIKQDISQKGFNINIIGLIASDDLASAQYATYTEKSCRDIGMHFTLVTCDKHAIADNIEKANVDQSVHGRMART